MSFNGSPTLQAVYQKGCTKSEHRSPNQKLPLLSVPDFTELRIGCECRERKSSSQATGAAGHPEWPATARIPYPLLHATPGKLAELPREISGLLKLL